MLSMILVIKVLVIFNIILVLVRSRMIKIQSEDKIRSESILDID